jgi:hypothetical protein
LGLKLRKKNNPKLPPGLVMPDDQSNDIVETPNMKPTSPEYELLDALGDIVQDIALIDLDLKIC